MTYCDKIPDWRVKNEGQEMLCRDYIFADFRGAMVFMNASAEIIEEMGLYPNWRNHNKHLTIELMANTEKNFELAFYMDRLFEEMIENG